MTQIPIASDAQNHLSNIDEAIQVISREKWVLPEIQEIPVRKALRHVLAEQVTARMPYPPNNVSAVDGFCFPYKPSFIQKATSSGVEIGGTIEAGRKFEGKVDISKAFRIFTGGLLPPGYSSVVKEEESSRVGDRVIFRVIPSEWENVKRRGEDISEGAIIGELGSILDPGKIIAFLSAGVSAVRVYRKLRVEIISTGDELLNPESKIENTTQPLLVSALSSPILDPYPGPVCPDEREAIAVAIDNAISRADAVAITGGSSRGEKDLVNGILKEVAKPILRGFKIKPGRTISMYSMNGRPVFSVSGIPFAALASTVVLLDAFIKFCLKLDKAFLPRVSVKAPIELSTDPEYYVVSGARIEFCTPSPSVHIVQERSKSGVGNLVGINSLVIIPPGKEPVAKGTALKAIMLW